MGLLVALVSVAGCGDDDGVPIGTDAGGGDAGGGTGDAGPRDAGPPMDGAVGTDAGPGMVDGGADVDAGGTMVDAGMMSLPDAAGIDAGPTCMPPVGGGGMVCAPGTNCLCCPAGGIAERCTCTTTCTSATDCTDPSRPICNRASPAEPGICTSPAFFCCWLCG